MIRIYKYIGLLVFILVLLNPSEKKFYRYVSAKHSSHKPNTYRSANFFIFSEYVYVGSWGRKTYYIGFAGNFFRIEK